VPLPSPALATDFAPLRAVSPARLDAHRDPRWNVGSNWEPGWGAGGRSCCELGSCPALSSNGCKLARPSACFGFSAEDLPSLDHRRTCPVTAVSAGPPASPIHLPARARLARTEPSLRWRAGCRLKWLPWWLLLVLSPATFARWRPARSDSLIANSLWQDSLLSTPVCQNRSSDASWIATAPQLRGPGRRRVDAAVSADRYGEAAVCPSGLRPCTCLDPLLRDCSRPAAAAVSAARGRGWWIDANGLVPQCPMWLRG